MIKFTAPAEKLYCEKCKDFVDYKIVERKDVYKVRDDEIEIDARIAFCSNCGSELLDIYLENENLKRAFRVYAKKHGLVLPEEIKSIREECGMSQESFAKMLGIEKQAIERYENGSLPSESISNLIRFLRDSNIQF
ncbi:MAG: type II TA system antitoxin MqsA family protein [Candidatus Hodarchaeales archaeon]